MNNTPNYERTDYAQLAKEFGGIKIGKYVVQFLHRDPSGRLTKLVQIIPLTGWVTNLKEVERIIRERGMEL